MPKTNFKKYCAKFLISFSFIIFFSFIGLSHVSAFDYSGASLTTLNSTPTSMTLSVSGLDNSTPYTFQVVSNTGTTSYTANSPTTNSSNLGVASYSFSGLSPGGSYTLSVVHTLDGTVFTDTFSTSNPAGGNAVMTVALTATSAVVNVTGLTSGNSYIVGVYKDLSSSSTPAYNNESSHVATSGIINNVLFSNLSNLGHYTAYITIDQSPGPNPLLTSLNFIAQDPPPPPTASPAGGTYNTAQSIVLSDISPNATIHYTIDGSSPTCSSPSYISTPITVSSNTTINTIACDAVTNTPSNVVSFNYIITTASSGGGGGGGNGGGGVGLGSAGGNLVPCGIKYKAGTGTGDTKTYEVSDPCQFSDILKLVNNIVHFILRLSIYIAAIMFCYAGFLMVTAGEESSHAREKAKKIVWGVVKGLFFVAACWLIISLILKTLGYNGFTWF